MKKYTLFLVWLTFIPAIFSQDCGNKILDNIGYTDWQDFVITEVASDGVYFDSKVINVNVSTLAVSPVRTFDTIIIHYPHVVGKLELYDDETGQSWIDWPMNLNNEIREQFKYFEETPSWQDVYTHEFPYVQTDCPTTEISQVQYRADRVGNIQVRFNQNHYQYLKDYDVFYDIVIESPICQLAEKEQFFTYSKSISVYNGICNESDEVGEQLIIKFGEVLFYKGLRREKDSFVITDSDWMINIQPIEKIGIAFGFSDSENKIDFVVVE